ncbi:Coronin-2B, variant 2 [Chamberlinius hualienensis]
MGDNGVPQMGFKGVRSSKFRHVFGSPAKRDKCYDNIKITKNAHDSHFCAVNPKFVAIVTEVAGGGAFLVLPIENVGRQDVGLSKVTGHRGPVLDLAWNPFNDNVIASCSDDCTIKLWYIPDDGLKQNLNEWLAELQGHQRRVAYIEWHPTAENILVSAGFDCLIIIWNIGSGEAFNVIDCHPDIIYSMSFNRDGSLLATTCKDKMLRIIEPRTGRVLNEGVCHSGSKAAKVVYLGDTGRLFTAGFSRHSDRQWAVWSQDDLTKPLRTENIDSSSGVLFPYYDHDTKMAYLAGKGDGSIRYYEIVDEPPWCHYLSQFLSGFPQRGLGWMPKRGVNIQMCEIFRFYKLHATKNTCEAVSMIVPRKSEQFQEDLYPDTSAPTPSLTAEEWLNGKNKNPVLISLKSGMIARTHKPVLYKNREHTLITSDRNNEKKFMFISQETKPDYREVHSDNEDNEDNKSENAGSKFQRIRQAWGSMMTQSTTNHSSNGVMLCDIVTAHKLPTATYVTLNERDIEIIDLDDSSPQSDEELRKTCRKQVEEIKKLRDTLDLKEQRIKELEAEIQQLRPYRKI